MGTKMEERNASDVKEEIFASNTFQIEHVSNIHWHLIKLCHSYMQDSK